MKKNLKLFSLLKIYGFKTNHWFFGGKSKFYVIFHLQNFDLCFKMNLLLKVVFK